MLLSPFARTDLLRGSHGLAIPSDHGAPTVSLQRATPSTALDACLPAKPSRAFGLHCFLCVVCEARLGLPGCYPCRIHRTHGPFGKSSILLFKPVATLKSFLATVCASSLTVLYPYLEQRQGQASSNHRVGLRSRLDLKSRSRKRRPTRLQVM
jgi:hypothetical protein